MTRTYWLSFTDCARPQGQQFLGATMVDVTEDDFGDPLVIMTALDYGGGEAFWIAAAIRKTHLADCNPGGEVTAIRVDEIPAFATVGALYPRLTLLTKAIIEQFDRHIEILL